MKRTAKVNVMQSCASVLLFSIMNILSYYKFIDEKGLCSYPETEICGRVPI